MSFGTYYTPRRYDADNFRVNTPTPILVDPFLLCSWTFHNILPLPHHISINQLILVATDHTRYNMKLSIAVIILPSLLAQAPAAMTGGPPPPLCPGGFVECDGGIVPGTSDTCTAACSGSCCQTSDPAGDTACTGFTGNVCKDGLSCMGKEACKNARIPHVAGSCSGDEACSNVGNQGLVGDFDNSCLGAYACDELARKGGEVGNIKDSCLGDYACNNLADEGGKVVDIINSCKGAYNACRDLAEEGGQVGHITNSCLGAGACRELANDGGEVGDIKDSCKGDDACDELAENGGQVGHITNSCDGTSSCAKLANDGGIAGRISFSCFGEYACSYAGLGVLGGLGDIDKSCNADYACESAGADVLNSNYDGDADQYQGYGDGPILSNLNSCCNTADACKKANQTTLPMNCKSGKSGKVGKVLKF